MSGAYFDGASAVGNLDLGTSTGLDSDQLLIHMWINPDPQAANDYIFSNNGASMQLRLGTNDRLRFECEDTGGVDIVVVNPSEVFTSSTGWTAIDIVVDTTQGFAKFYINGLLASNGSATPTGNTIDWSENNFQVGARTGTTDGYVGDLYQFAAYNFFSSDYVSSTGELTAKYFAEMYDIDSAGTIYPKQASIAPALGTMPLVLLEGEYSSFEANSGTEGDMPTTYGAPLPLRSSPPFGSWSFTAP